ncbi:hypothetical protein J2Y69_000714 [Microbacterium resistens]|uniref:PH domain-containing protein n=1 Tax=Microbacterium resistens TaxID=156977 RepID=A0ABU1S934_9MICO|nr:hypothetical protein [Microbacterium resistens]MDR6866129.1 hypothetical protein [Microbacterium resistens]
MSGMATDARFVGTRTFSRRDARPWWWILIGVNGAMLLILGGQLLGAVAFHQTWTGVVIGLILLVVANAVLIPIVAVMTSGKIVIDFDRGTIGASSSAQMPVSEFTMIVDNHRTFPQVADNVELVFARGSIGVDVGAIRQTPAGRERNEALIAYILRWLPAPERHRSALGQGAAPGIARFAIGKEEAIQLLRQP